MSVLSLRHQSVDDSSEYETSSKLLMTVLYCLRHHHPDHQDQGLRECWETDEGGVKCVMTESGRFSRHGELGRKMGSELTVEPRWLDRAFLNLFIYGLQLWHFVQQRIPIALITSTSAGMQLKHHQQSLALKT